MRSLSSNCPALILLGALFLASLQTGCAGDHGPAQGYWGGSKLTFQVKAGQVLDLRPASISCNGESGCFAEFFFVDPSLSLPILAGSFSGTLENAMGAVTLSGSFDSSTAASGTFEFVSASGCCTQSGTWKAEFLSPYEEPDEDDVGAYADSDPALPDVSEDTGPVSSEYPASASEAQIVAVQYSNELRHALGLPLLVEIEPINLAAQAHADYFELQCQNYLNSNLSPHSENAAWKEGFSGNNFSDRMSKFGFVGIPGWEVMAFNGNAVAAIDGWVATLYHRIPFVHPSAFEMGFGTTKGGCFNWSGGTDVMDFSRHSVSFDHAVAYPYDGQTDVVPGWGGYESPQPPMPSGQAYPSGPIITLTFPEGGGKFTITGHELLDPEGNAVAHMYVDPASDPAGFLSQTVSIYSYQPLQGFSQYTVRFTGSWKNQEQTWEWQFETGAEQSQYW
jgi:uncharacterized protein YkwD